MTEATATLTLTEFLLARIAEDEADANLCIHPYGQGVTPPTLYERHENWPQGKAWYEDGWSSDEAPHLSRWSPARVLAECEAKRRIVEESEQVATCSGYLPPGEERDAFDARLGFKAYRHLPEEYAPGCDGCAAAETSGVPASVLRRLAAVYSDHPDYREEWRP